MSTSADRLLYKLHQSRYVAFPSADDTLRMNRSIEALDAIDPSFSENAKRLMDDSIASWLSAHPVSWADNKGWVDPDTSIEKALVSWVDSDHRINNAITAAEHIRNLSGMDYNAATFVLEDAILQGSLSRLDLSEWLEAARYGHRCLLSETASPHLTLISDSTEEVDRYCHPLAVASIIMKLLRDDKRFIREAPEFIAWAGAQVDMSEVLSVALRISSTEPVTIREYMKQLEETPNPLHGGVL